VLNDAHIQSHTIHPKKFVEPVVASHTTNIMPGANCRYVGPQNGSTPHEYAVQSPHVVLGVVLHVLTHLSTHVIKNYLLVETVSPYGQPNPARWVLIPLKLHLHVDMP
jgi:hypothetical protein